MPSKIQFDQLATCWVTSESGVEKAVTQQVIKQTYRLNFEHCATNTCKRNCIGNPRCLSALGGTFLANHNESKLNDIADLKSRETRDLSEPAGLRNLGATCYLNSLLQVWFHNATFRDVILQWNRELDCAEQNSLSFDLPETIVGHIQLIFARLLRSIRRCVDPTALVEVLGLDAEYQQDASECFSLLFNVILEQLRIYGDGSLAKELAEAYRGKQVTVIQCESCGGVRRCQQDFYNMILNVQGHRDVRQCIKSLGQSRKIEGDFTCGVCRSKKGAVTYEEFTEMPPVLNLQLMRYRYDAKSGTKKKVQTVLRFPEVLDLGPYVKEFRGEKLYELRAVLVHVGHSANSGHYIANVRAGDDGIWYRLNDENVSAMKGRPDLSSEAEITAEKDGIQEKNGLQHEKNTSNGNGLRIGKEDEEQTGPAFGNVSNVSGPGIVNAASPSDLQTTKVKRSLSKAQKNPNEKSENDEHTFSSTGAYMLVYERVTAERSGQNERKSTIARTLHNYLEGVIQREHIENTKLVEEIESIRASSTSKAQELLADFKEIFSVLPYKTDDDYRFVATTNLTNVIKRAERLFKSICSSIEQPMAQTSSSKGDIVMKLRENPSNDFSCIHEKLSPESTALSKLKVISSVAAALLDAFCAKYDFGETWHQEPKVPQELCRECVVLLGRRVAQFSQLVADNKALTGLLKNKDCEKSFWVCGKSLQNWLKLAENQILSTLGTAPAETVDIFNDKLRCVHGNLAIENKKSIPEEAWNIIKKYFPKCVTYPNTAPECDKCHNESLAEEAIASERAGAISIIRQSLRNLIRLRRNFLESETEVYAIHKDQAAVVRKYLRARITPSEVPTNLPNALLCAHGKSLVFENDGTFSEAVVLLTHEEGAILREKFSIDSFVNIKKDETSFQISPAPCEDCLQRKILEAQKAQLEFHNIEIPVVKLALQDLIEKHSALINPEKTLSEVEENSTAEAAEPALKKQRLARNSRIPNAKTVHLSSNETFVDLKVKIMAKHHITPILQVILNGDKLLRDVDGQIRISELGIRADSILYVAETIIRENESDLSSEKKKNVKEEIGFGGTKLMS